ncbi:hypothetical protein NPIL_25341 [Nephila pilipes]|uniref:Uncharacterized protein n=1 Tax=Nephila pilipes TaxID=299642 RepID=A0A8X6QTN7_NEPPI|nr:hypothetical protein NPIL_25341 [Nephila pilipes]
MVGSGPDFFPGGSWGPILGAPRGPEKAISRLLWDLLSLQGDAAFNILSVLPIACRSEPWFPSYAQNQVNMETGLSSGFVSQQWGRVTPQITRTEKLFHTLPQSSPDAP